MDAESLKASVCNTDLGSFKTPKEIMSALSTYFSTLLLHLETNKL